jgi:hypothetical protein
MKNKEKKVFKELDKAIKKAHKDLTELFAEYEGCSKADAKQGAWEALDEYLGSVKF